MDKNTIAFQKRPSRGATAAVVLFTFLLTAPGLPDLKAAPKENSLNVIPTITSIGVENGQLVASGTATAILHGRTNTVPFTAPVNIAVAEDQTGAGACPILDLMLGPINLDLLGLVVETTQFAFRSPLTKAEGCSVTFSAAWPTC